MKPSAQSDAAATIRHATRRGALLLGVAGVLSGCGFQPVYMAKGTGPGPADALAEIEIKPLYERPGQILRQALLGRFRSESGTPRRADLQVNFWISGEAQGVLNFTQPTRIRLVGNANWTLTARDAKATRLAEGAERVVDGFDIFDTEYFAIDLNNEQVQRRIAEEMASRITLRLATWLHAHPTALG
jgi:hypothetical protein